METKGDTLPEIRGGHREIGRLWLEDAMKKLLFQERIKNW
jgi:hypothetical protein